MKLNYKTKPYNRKSLENCKTEARSKKKKEFKVINVSGLLNKRNKKKEKSFKKSIKIFVLKFNFKNAYKINNKNKKKINKN